MFDSGNIEKVRVHLSERSYDILIASGLLKTRTAADALRRKIAGKPVLLVADTNTAELYGEYVLDLLRRQSPASCSMHVFEAGESSKNLANAEMICRAAFRSNLDRSGVIIALGGGVTGDMAGFAAAVYMRGIECIQIPTSLLAMIDSSVGGKTAVDLPDGKNLIGAFHQPQLVLIDVDMLETLPAVQMRSGAAELIKHAILFDSDLFAVLESSPEELLELRNKALWARLIARSCALKAEVVADDERETARRALLNLGHSFGHALEKLQDFSGYSHGEAVAYGTAVAASLAQRLGHLKYESCERIIMLLRSFDLPVSSTGFLPVEILAAMAGDKKNIGGRKRLVLPFKIGRCEIVQDAEDADILAAIGEHCD